MKKVEHLKFAMMSGAIKNAGDFLIVKRSEELLKNSYPDAQFYYFNRNGTLEPYLEEINKMDAMVFCGGPAYIPQVYPVAFPLVSNLNDIKVPIFTIGLGWFGNDANNKTVYNYPFTNESKKFLKRIETDTGVLSCRDWYSVNVLRNNGIYAGKMTGCPAWYDLQFIEKETFVNSNPYEVKKICISDVGNIQNVSQMLNVVRYVKQVYSNAEIKVVFHRGVTADMYTSTETGQILKQVTEECQKQGVECVDISYGEQGFSIYDDCDLHVGFRVHAHIYNLSRRNVSILIEEDGRGAGVNDALGLENLVAFECGQNNQKHENEYLLFALDDYVNNLYQSDFIQIKNAYRMMKQYFETMRKHIEGLERYI